LKLNIGCGQDIRSDFINVDMFYLPGVDVVHDARIFPWPFKDNEATEIVLIHILEHLPDTIRTMEEIYRISKNEGKVKIFVPLWNSDDFVTDPTHIKMFGVKTFNFFDPRLFEHKKRAYYSGAKFHIEKKIFTFKILNRYYPIPSALSRVFEALSYYFCNIIQVMEIHLETIK